MSDNIDVTRAIAPKTDQLNSDDLVTGPITVKIRDVHVKESGEQRISVYYEGDNGKPWKPCVTQARLIAAIWGANAKNWIGRSLTLYRNPGVKWGGVEVGGIEVSHMSHIEKPITMALTKTKGVKKPHQVKPLQVSTPASAPAGMDPAEREKLRMAARKAAEGGNDALKAHWQGLGGALQNKIGGAAFLDELKFIAADSTPGAPVQAEQNSPVAATSAAVDEVPFDV